MPSANGVDSGESAMRRKKTVKKIAFLATHCLIDFNSDTARAMHDGLQLLARTGFECQAFCGTHFDAAEEILTEEVLAQQRLRYEVRNAQIGPHRARMIFTACGKVPLTLFNTISTRGVWRDDAEVAAFLSACEIFLTKNRPDAVWTCGIDPVSLEMQRLAMRLDIPIVLTVDDAAYSDDSVFQRADYAVVFSEQARQFHWKNIGLASLVLPPVVNPPKVAGTVRVPSANSVPGVPATFGDHISHSAGKHIQQEHPDRLAPLYRDFFSSITHQPGPPLVPRAATK